MSLIYDNVLNIVWNFIKIFTFLKKKRFLHSNSNCLVELINFDCIFTAEEEN